jgi:hypothetical protein
MACAATADRPTDLGNTSDYAEQSTRLCSCRGRRCASASSRSLLCDFDCLMTDGFDAWPSVARRQINK